MGTLRDVIRTRYVQQDGRLYARSWQNGVDKIAEQVKQRREITPRKSDFAQPMAIIPKIVREDWKRKGREDLLRGDQRAMERWLNSPEGKPWDQRRKGRSRSFSFGGI